MNDFDPIEWITTQEAAALTGYNPVHIRRLIKAGKIKGVKRAHDWFLVKADVIAYMEEVKRLGQAIHDPWRSGARKKTIEE